MSTTHQFARFVVYGPKSGTPIADYSFKSIACLHAQRVTGTVRDRVTDKWFDWDCNPIIATQQSIPAYVQRMGSELRTRPILGNSTIRIQHPSVRLHNAWVKALRTRFAQSIKRMGMTTS